MKTILTTLSLVLASSAAFAGFPPTYSCSNLNGTIQISGYGQVKIVERYEPTAVVKTFDRTEVTQEKTLLKQMAREVRGCSSEEVSFQRITLSKVDGTALPNAYNQLADEGKLTDYFICSVSNAWMPREGESCFSK